MSIKQLLVRDEEVQYNETPSRTKALIGFILGFVGYMYIFPFLLFSIIIKIKGFTKETPVEILNKYSLLSQVISGVVVLIIMIFFISRKEMKNAIKNFDSNTFILGLKYFVISFVLTFIWNTIYMLFGGDLSDNANQESLNTLMTQTPALTITLTCLVAPLLEELIFRYYMYKGIEDQNPIVAVFLTAFLFAFIHLFASISTGTFLEDLKTFPGYFLPSLVMTYAYYKHRKLGVSVVCHMTNNIFATIMFFLQRIVMAPGTSDIVSEVILCLLG